MAYQNIPYKSFFWSLGTTSFRTRNFNRNIELQLHLLNNFWGIPENSGQQWKGNNTLQARYYDYMKDNNFVVGNAPQKAKDAREKTSGLVDIGLITEDRKLTEVGNILLQISHNNDFSSDNFLKIPKDSFIYLKQLLKTSITVSDDTVRPFIVLLHLLTELEHLTLDEFTYLLPLCINKEATTVIKEMINNIRKELTTIDNVLLDIIMSLTNYKVALDLFMKENVVSEDLICVIGMNRKSRNYDRPYYQLYRMLKEVFLNKDLSYIVQLFNSTKSISGTLGVYWRELLFKTQYYRSVLRSPDEKLRKDNIFSFLHTEDELKLAFFKMLHLYKTKATLSDYLDLNRRYIKNTDVVLFDDSIIKLDIIPKHFFGSAIESLDRLAYTDSEFLHTNCPLRVISDSLVVEPQKIIEGINEEFDASITTMDEATNLLEDERYRRLHILIDKRFSDTTLLNLLEYCFCQAKSVPPC